MTSIRKGVRVSEGQPVDVSAWSTDWLRDDEPLRFADDRPVLVAHIRTVTLQPQRGAGHEKRSIASASVLVRATSLSCLLVHRGEEAIALAPPIAMIGSRWPTLHEVLPGTVPESAVEVESRSDKVACLERVERIGAFGSWCLSQTDAVLDLLNKGGYGAAR